MNIIFLGTPAFALPALESIYNSRHKILAVISQPDRETDRKGALKPTPVKKRALELGLKLYQFEKVSTDGIEIIQSLKPDVMVTAAFGQMLSEKFLSIPKIGVFNIHGSLLPLYRGASPMQTAILNGDYETGVTIMKTVYQMDAGDMLKRAAVKIDDTTTLSELHDRLSVLGADLIVQTLNELEDGHAVFTPQDGSKATYTKKLTKVDGHIDFSHDADKVVRRINALPAYAFFNGENIKIHSAKKVIYSGTQKAGQVLSYDREGIIVKCGNNAIKILSLQAPGKKRLNSDEFLRGYKIEIGEMFE